MVNAAKRLTSLKSKAIVINMLWNRAAFSPGWYRMKMQAKYTAKDSTAFSRGLSIKEPAYRMRWPENIMAPSNLKVTSSPIP